MKKKILTWVLLMSLILIGCGPSKPQATEDELRFKEEYESLNGQVSESGKEYPKVELPMKNLMKYASGEEVITMLKEGTGVIFFGFPECPWCRQALPILIDAATNTGVEQILYYNNKDQRDELELNEQGEVITKKEGTEEYFQILDLLGEFADEYNGLENPSIKRLYFPTVVVIEEGEVLGTHMSTVSSMKDPYTTMTLEQKEELQSIYEDLFVLLSACNIGGC